MAAEERVRNQLSRALLRNLKGNNEDNKPVPDEPESSKYMPKSAGRIQKLIAASADKAPPALVPYIKKLEPVLAMFIWVLAQLAPLFGLIFSMVESFLDICPPDLVQSVVGLIVCFFGGFFPTTIAASEAWVQAGGNAAQESLMTLINELKQLKSENDKDDELDEDGDGIADVDQITGTQLMQRKLNMFLMKTHPKLLNDSMVGVYMGWLGVVATLKLQFAKTIALGSAIGEILKRPFEWVLVPVLVRVMPEDYHPWIEVIINTICKSIAISIAWTIQRIISAFHSAIRGGLMFGRGIISYLHNAGWLSYDHEESIIDEIIGWSTAAAGFYVQFQLRFSLPFILNIILWPFTVIEWYIVWTISE